MNSEEAELDREMAELEAAFGRGLVIADQYNARKMEIQQRKASLLSLCIEALRASKIKQEDDDLQKLVLCCIQSRQGDSTLADIERDVQYPQPQILAAVRFLLNEGWIYCTLDENHFRAVDGLGCTTEPSFMWTQRLD